jgi:hypothetical protein
VITKKPFLLRLTTLTLLLSLPLTAYAASGGQTISNMFVTLIQAFSFIVIPIAVLVVIICGFVLMISTDEGHLAKARSTIIAATIGGILATVIYEVGPVTFISNIYNGQYGLALANTGGNIGAEAEGISDWIVTMTVMFGVLTIIIAVFRAIASFGGDEAAYSAVRTSLLHVIIGLVLIASAKIVSHVFFFDHDPFPLIAVLSGKFIFILNIITTIAVAILVYAGLRMVISFGKEEEFTAAKSLAIRVIIGLVIVLLSYALVFAVVTIFGTAGP